MPNHELFYHECVFDLNKCNWLWCVLLSFVVHWKATERMELSEREHDLMQMTNFSLIWVQVYFKCVVSLNSIFVVLYNLANIVKCVNWLPMTKWTQFHWHTMRKRDRLAFLLLANTHAENKKRQMNNKTRATQIKWIFKIHSTLFDSIVQN